ncbi:AAA family ATPase [Chloroflexota bacterium]
MSTTKIRSFDDFLALFPESPRQKILGGWNIICPAHQDKNPSLSATLKANRILVKCQAGCKTEDVVKLNGLTLADLFLESTHRPEDNKQKTLVATFPYECEKGQEAYQIRRFDLGNKNKTFEAWHKEGGEYAPGMGDYKGKPILYHQPEIPGWIATARRIYIPEGERKADLIISKGGAATTSPFGAGRNKWRPEFSEVLSGAEVVILPDNDKPGHDFAQDKAASLHGVAKSVKILELPGLPEKDDVIDWFNAGGTFEQLEQLVSQAPERTPLEDKNKFTLTTIAQLLAEPEEISSWLWDKTLPSAGLSILASKPKVGKTTLARNLALKVARGDAFLGRNVTPGPVVYLALEEKRAEVAAHFARMGANDERILIHTGSAPQKAIAALKTSVIQTGAVLAIVDPLFRMVRIRDGNDYAEVTRALEPLLMLARETGCHILTVHHSAKSEREGGDGILGSTALFGSVDTALIMKRRESGRTLESIQRYGLDIPRTLLTFDPETGVIDTAGTVDELDMQRLSDEVLQTLEAGELTEKEIRDAIGGNKGLAGKALRKLLAENEVTREGSGRRGDPFKYTKILVSSFTIGDKQEKQVNEEALDTNLSETSPTPHDDIPDYPTAPCHNCGSRDYWLRESWGRAEWLCSQCHPKPGGES